MTAKGTLAGDLRRLSEKSLLEVLQDVPAQLKQAAQQSQAAREEHLRRVEVANEWIKAGSRPSKHRFRL